MIQKPLKLAQRVPTIPPSQEIWVSGMQKRMPLHDSEQLSLTWALPKNSMS